SGQQPSKCVSIRTCCLRERVEGLRTVTKQLGNPELGRDVNHRRHAMRLDKIEKLESRGRRRHGRSISLLRYCAFRMSMILVTSPSHARCHAIAALSSSVVPLRTV